MGRPRKPTRLKVLDNDQPCRINRSEPDSPGELGEPPDWLDDHARTAWARLKERLAPMRVATRADEELVTIYCQAYSTWRQALELIESEGMIVESVTEIVTKNGSTIRCVKKANPLLPAAQESQRRMQSCLSQLGMNPSARAGLKVEAEKPDDALAEFMARKPKAGTGNGKRRPS